MRPDLDGPRDRNTAQYVLNVLSSVLSARTVAYAAREANLDYWWAVLCQKRGCRR